MILLISIVAILVLVGLFFLTTQRQLVALEERVKNALSQIGVQTQTRWDAVTALVKLVDKYSKHEHDTLMDAIKARRLSTINTAEDVAQQQSALGQVMGQLNAVVERYPELKASELYTNTMDQINEYENNVRMSRQIYNDTATRMNSYVRQLPTSIVANSLGFKTVGYLEEVKEKSDMPNV